jgi:hypothetical protein
MLPLVLVLLLLLILLPLPLLLLHWSLLQVLTARCLKRLHQSRNLVCGAAHTHAEHPQVDKQVAYQQQTLQLSTLALPRDHPSETVPAAGSEHKDYNHTTRCSGLCKVCE